MLYLMTTFRCPSDILITSWLFTAWWSTWPGNHLVSCVAELVGSCIPIHAHRCLPDPKCLFYPSGLSLCLSVDHFCLVPVDDMILFHGMVCSGSNLSDISDDSDTNFIYILAANECQQRNNEEHFKTNEVPNEITICLQTNSWVTWLKLLGSKFFYPKRWECCRENKSFS